jgi:hypothetical protein
MSEAQREHKQHVVELIQQLAEHARAATALKGRLQQLRAASSKAVLALSELPEPPAAGTAALAEAIGGCGFSHTVA